MNEGRHLYVEWVATKPDRRALGDTITRGVQRFHRPMRAVPMLCLVLVLIPGCTQQLDETTTTPVVQTTSTSTTLTVPTTEAPELTVDPLLEQALEILETNALVRDQVDWEEVRERSYRALESSGTLFAIEIAVAHVSRIDGHSFTLPPAPSDAPYGGTTYNPAEVELIDGQIGLIVLETFGPGDPELISEYTADLHSKIADARSNGVCGWVVDLSGHQGGNMWPGVAGLAPILGVGPVGYFEFDGVSEPWMVGREGVGVNAPREVLFDEPIPEDFSQEPVAVVVSRLTASSGEAVALAFRGRPDTRLFGQPTAGLATVNRTYTLDDGSIIALTVGLMADRTGTAVPLGEPIEPHENADLGTGAALDAAVAWLEAHTACGPDGSG